MKKRLLSAAFLLSGVMSMQAQVGIGTLNPNNSAMLEVASTDKGILIPRIALASKTDTTTITSGNVNSLLVFNTTNNDEIQPGYYYWFEDSWKKLAILEDINQETVTVLNALDAAVYEYISEDNTSTIINVPQDVINNFTTITNDENVFNHLVEIIHNNAGNVYYDGSTFTYLDENNVFQTINFEEIVQNYETATTLVYNSITNELIYTDENGEEHTYVLNNTKITGFTIENHIATIFDSEGQEFSMDLSNYLDNTDEQEITELSITDNILTISIENGNTKTVDLTTLLNGTHLEAGEHIQISGTGDADDPYVISSVNTTNETLVIEENILKLIDSDGTELSVSLNDYLDNTDSQNITELYLEGDQLVIAIENGNTKTVDLTTLLNGTHLEEGEHIQISGTGDADDPYVISSVNTTNETLVIEENILKLIDSDGTELSVSLNDYLDNTDSQNITELYLEGEQLVIAIENGNTKTVDLTTLLNGTHLEAGEHIQISGTGDADDPYVISSVNTTNETLVIEENILKLIDSDGTELSVSLNDYLDNTDSQNITELYLEGEQLVIAIENGNTKTVDLTTLLNGTHLEAGEHIQISGTGDADDPYVISSVNTTNETLVIEENILKLIDSDGTELSVSLNDYLDNTDSQNITELYLEGEQLVIAIENGNTKTVDLTTLLNGTHLEAGEHIQISGTGDADDPYVISSVNTTNETLVIEENILKLIDSDGTELSVSLNDYLDNTDSQNITELYLEGDQLVIAIENGNTKTVDLTTLLNGTHLEEGEHIQISGTGDADDPYVISSVNTTNETLVIEENILKLIDSDGTELSVSLNDYLDNTDSQNITELYLEGEQLVIAIENGNTKTVDLTTLLNGTHLEAGEHIQISGTGDADDPYVISSVNTTNETLVIEENILKLIDSDGTELSVSLNDYLDNTDSQNITELYLEGEQLVIAIENGNTKTVDLTTLLNGTHLEAGEHIQISGTGDADDPYVISSVNTTNETLVIEENILKLIDSDGTELSVSLNDYLDNTDSQNITELYLEGEQLVIAIENGNTKTVDLTTLLNGTHLEAGEHIQISGTGDADDPYVISSVNTTNETLVIEENILKLIDSDGTELSVSLNDYLDNTDSQNITELYLEGDQLVIAIENGNTKTVDLTTLLNGTHLEEGEHIQISGTGDADDPYVISSVNTTNETLVIEENILKLIDSDGTELSVSLNDYLDNTDSQNITELYLEGEQLVIAIENGNTKTVDLTTLLNGTHLEAGEHIQISGTGDADDPYVISSVNTTNETLVIEENILKLIDSDGTELSVSLNDYLDNTDSQNITELYLEGEQLVIAIENGNTKTVDLTTLLNGTHLEAGEHIQISGTGDADDPYVISSVNTTNETLVIEENILKLIDSDGTELSVSLNDYLDNTDSQNITELYLEGEQLVIAIENGNTKTVDLTTLLNGTHLEAGEHIQISGTGDADDPYVISSVNTTNETLVIEENILKLIDSDGTELSVSLNDYLDNTDSQNITELYLEGEQLVIAIENGNTKTVDLTTLLNGTHLEAGEHIQISGTGDADDPYVISSVNTTNETLVIEENILKLIDSDGTELSVSLNDYLDNTDSQNITELYLEGDQLVIAIENGNTKTVDLSYFFNTTTLQQGEHITITGTGTVEDPYIINAEKTTLSEGSNVTIEETTDGLFTNYTISVPTANGNALGVVKEAADNPTVSVSQTGELSVNLENINAIKEVSSNYNAILEDA